MPPAMPNGENLRPNLLKPGGCVALSLSLSRGWKLAVVPYFAHHKHYMHRYVHALHPSISPSIHTVTYYSRMHQNSRHRHKSSWGPLCHSADDLLQTFFTNETLRPLARFLCTSNSSDGYVQAGPMGMFDVRGMGL